MFYKFFCFTVASLIGLFRKHPMILMFSEANRCPLAEFLNSIILIYPPAGSSIVTVFDVVIRKYLTGVSCPAQLPFP